MTESLSIAIPCRVDEPDIGTTLASLAVACSHTQLPRRFIVELIVCINGVQAGKTCEALITIRDFCEQQGIPREEVWVRQDDQQSSHAGPPIRETDSGKWGNGESKAGRRVFSPSDSPYFRFSAFASNGLSNFPRCIVLLTDRKGKPLAWNMLWRQSQGALVLFADADVRVDRDAVYALYTRMQSEPHLRLVAAREVPILRDGGTLWSRMGAIPYRFNFGNAGGRLLLIRKTALLKGMPEDLLLEDAWLTVVVGRKYVAKELAARVYFLPPATARDYVAERIRTEGGKLQIRWQHGDLLATGPIAQYRWFAFWQEIALHEYPLVLLALLVRGLARGWAMLALAKRDFYALYRPFTSTKGWRRRGRND